MTHDWWNNEELQKEYQQRMMRSRFFDWIVKSLVLLFFAAVITCLVILVGLWVTA